MNSDQFSKYPPSWERNLTEKRQKIISFLSRNAPVLEDLYKAALQIFFDENFPARHILIAHTVREIQNRLPDAIAGPKKTTSVMYINDCENILEAWEDAGYPLDGSLSGIPTNIATEPSGTNSTALYIKKKIIKILSKLLKAPKFNLQVQL